MTITGTEPAESRNRLSRADHASAAYAADLAECDRAVNDRSGLHFLAHITSGIVDFSVEFPGAWSRGQQTTGAFERAARQLNLAVSQLDSACEPLDSGALIRVVIQGENGALFQVLKVAGQSFFGMTTGGTPETVDHADRQISRLAESAARRMGAASLLWGGFRSREDSGELWRSYKVEPPTQSVGPPYVAASNETAVTGAVTDACLAALHPGYLHYVGIFQRGQAAWCADIFDAPALLPFFQRVTPWSRRRGYDRLMRQVNLQIRRFGQLLALVHSDHLVRLVLDVARGAVYVLPLHDDEYLLGVTLIQSRVDSADRKMRELHETVRSVTGRARGDLPIG
jgi:hypothetical protein